MTFVDIGKKLKDRDHKEDIEKVRERDGIREEARGKKNINFPRPQFDNRHRGTAEMAQRMIERTWVKPNNNAETLVPAALEGLNYLASRPIEVGKQKILHDKVKGNVELQKCLKDALSELCPSIPVGNWGKAAVIYGHTYYQVKVGQSILLIFLFGNG